MAITRRIPLLTVADRFLAPRNLLGIKLAGEGEFKSRLRIFVLLRAIHIDSPDYPDRERHGFSLKNRRDERACAKVIVDFFALVRLENDLEYLVPAWSTIEGNRARLEKYREGWGQFK